MKILLSGLFVRQGAVGGAEHMFYNLVRGMAEHQYLENLTVAVPQEGCAINFLEYCKDISSVQLREYPVPGNRFVAEQTFACRTREKFDCILFPNYFCPLLLSQRHFRKVVTVIHDLQYCHFPEYFSQKKRLWLRAAHLWALQRSDVVVVISESVSNDILRYYGNRWKNKLQVIHNPVSWDRFEEGKQDNSGDFYSLPDSGGEYILSVAAQYPHKNLTTLIKAFARVRRLLPSMRLVLTGQLSDNLAGDGKNYVDIRKTIRHLDLEQDVMVTGYVDDPTLGRLYRGARLFVFPSVFEGFGMPPVEAMGMGVPTVTTRCSSLPEVTCGHALYIEDPYSEKEMAEAMLRGLEQTVSDEARNEIRQRYHPEKIAGEYFETIKQ